MTESVVSGGRRDGVHGVDGADIVIAGEQDRASGTPAGPVPGKGTGGTGLEAFDGPAARTGSGRAVRRWSGSPGEATAAGTARRTSGASMGPASTGSPGWASGRARTQARNAGRSPAATAQRSPGTASGMLDGVRRWLAESGAEPTPARVAQALREQGRVLGDAEVLGAAEQLRSELVGSGPLEPLLADPSVTDVLVSAPDRVWVDRGGGLELAPVSFPDAGAVRRLAQRLATVAGRRLDDARPWVDARLPDGTRLHAVLPPVAVDCTCLSLRVVRPRAFTLDELTAAGTVPPGGDRVLRALLRARLSFLVSGGTGSGNPNMVL
ncbi:hypothetical protein GCM10010330_11400 [Streptomyces tendae]|nr:hypothetical protein GCM10010330_11400 [Streptomyces tendae]